MQLHFQHGKKQLAPIPPVQPLGILALHDAGRRYMSMLLIKHKDAGLKSEEGV
jgi:hypothetical protein